MPSRIHYPTLRSYLVEIGLQEVHLLVSGQQTRPVLLFEFLLPQNQFNLAVIVVDFRVLGVNLRV